MILNEHLTQDVYERNVLKESARLVSKWGKTGLLDGLDQHRASNMARLFENQARWILKEASVQADIIGFQNVAFPMVRRAFAGLVANELVGVQPLALPSGLIFYFDYRFDTVKAGNKNADFTTGGSLFGERNSLQDARGAGAMYNFGTSYSQRERVSVAQFTGSYSTLTLADIDYDPDLSGSIGGAGYKKLTLTSAYSMLSASGSLSGVADLKHWVPVSASSTSFSSTTDGTPVQYGSIQTFRRFTKQSGDNLVFVVSGAAADFISPIYKVSYLVAATLTGGTSGTLVLDPYESDMAASPTPTIPEIDFRIQSESVTAQPRKLKVKWTPELAQDLAAYQALDAEVELTTVMSEQIALEIDREILADLLHNATGGTRYWSRKPGKFVNKLTGDTESGASFTGTVREWYETLVETIIDLANDIHTKTLRGAANFCVTSPNVSTIVEASVLYKPSLSLEPKETMLTIGTEKIGTLNSRFTVYKDPYFPKNVVLVGFKGTGFLEVGYVYAPYVPLIVTPVVYAPEDMTPRKMVMTRYAKKMVRSDFYGRVIIQDMNVI
jgi:hypothetical protein